MDIFAGALTLPDEGFIPVGFNGGPPDDETPEAHTPTEPSGGPTCEVCGIEVPLTPTGRRPRHPLCQDHKTRTSTPRAGKSTALKAAADDKTKQARLDAITGDLQEGLGELCGTIAPFAPVTGVTVALQGPKAVDAVVRIAADYPRFLDGLEMAAKAVPFISVGRFVAALVLAMGVDMGRVAPIGAAAEFLGVAEAAAQAGWQPPEERQRQQAQTDPMAVPVPRFKL